MRPLLLMTLLLSTQAAADRVEAARKSKGERVAELFRAAGVAYPPRELYLRAFKAEREVEVWAGEPGKALVKVKTYPFCEASGDLGPKRRQGDLQVPEGFYLVDRFNPTSNFHLSFRVNYPNESDRVLGEKGNLGGDIYVHGDCASIGCIAIENDPIEELYLMVLDTHRGAGRAVPIHIFPRRLDEQGLTSLAKHARAEEHLSFWRSLQPGYLLFEQSRRPPRVSVDPKTGAYRVTAGR